MRARFFESSESPKTFWHLDCTESSEIGIFSPDEQGYCVNSRLYRFIYKLRHDAFSQEALQSKQRNIADNDFESVRRISFFLWLPLCKSKGKIRSDVVSLRPPGEPVSKFTRLILVIVFLPLWLNGCVPAAVLVAQKGIKSALEVRPLSRQLEDAKIHANLLQEYLRVDSGLPVDVNTDVWEGRVLLTGLVDSKKKQDAILSITRGDSRIEAVYDHILLGSPAEVARNREVAKTQPAAERDVVKISRIASDVWIEAKLKTQFLTAEGVKSVNYRWQSVRNKVYIIGRARTEFEKNLVLQIIRGTKGVIHLEEYIQVKSTQK